MGEGRENRKSDLEEGSEIIGIRGVTKMPNSCGECQFDIDVGKREVHCPLVIQGESNV